MLEVDCHITADGLVVISHDNTLKRTCGKEVDINEVSYKVGMKDLCEELLGKGRKQEKKETRPQRPKRNQLLRMLYGIHDENVVYS